MNTDYTALALVIDRSGSMQSTASDVVGSVKQLIGEQKKNSGKASLTVTQFDHAYEVIHDFKDIQEVDEELFAKAYAPRGSTALLDAIGRTVIGLTQKLDSLAEEDKPKRVIIAIITDGLENASTEFNITQIKEMIKEEEALGWDCMFIGATLDTIDIAKNFGFSAHKTAVYETAKFSNSMQLINEQVSKARLGKEVTISEEERSKLIASI
jgi:Mg-chelatase subunit ChlD